MTKDSSPVPQQKSEGFPICNGCKGPLHEVRYLDYGEVRVVFHTDKGCVVGVMEAR